MIWWILPHESDLKTKKSPKVADNFTMQLLHLLKRVLPPNQKKNYNFWLHNTEEQARKERLSKKIF